DLAKSNNYFRQVISTNQYSQVVLMSLLAGEDIGLETHPDVDQILIFVAGQGSAVLNGVTSQITAGDLVVVPAGTEHNFINQGDGEMKLYTVYAPAEHRDGTIHKTKAEALADTEDHQ
ncbi:MAG: cupin domain-containing protein, partial [Candidatus Komeilibacteria bacterium]|nr:cupin domain-containing protein [Candidatus Komeilibacteria bacterium]